MLQPRNSVAPSSKSSRLTGFGLRDGEAPRRDGYQGLFSSRRCSRISRRSSPLSRPPPPEERDQQCWREPGGEGVHAGLIVALNEMSGSAKFRRTKGAVKVHVGLDHEGYLPTFVRVTNGKTSDIEAARALTLPKGSIVAADRTYVDLPAVARVCCPPAPEVRRLRGTAEPRPADNEGHELPALRPRRLERRSPAPRCTHDGRQA